ncbi:MAG: glycosyltransferase [Gemmatimonadota bacterium]|nr:glycosyltransferase [Gemmatimonadota bacterium]
METARVLIAHDWLVTWAGSERCVEQLLEIFPQADLVVGVRTPDMNDFNHVTRRATETWLGRLPGARRHHRWFVPLQPFAFASIDTSRYDLVISSSHAFSKAVKARRGGHHICFCYSPPRYLWHLATTYHRGATQAQRAALAVGAPVLRWLDRRAARRVDDFITISKHIATRIQRVYGRSATVVYPPVVRKPGNRSETRGDCLLSLGRLVPYKRVDLAIKAAEHLGVPLIVAGDGPDRSRLERLAGRQTQFVGEVSEEEAGRLLSSCAAFVFCAEEDFGIAPLEANAHGTPVVGYRAGGLCETMVEGETAEFFDQQTATDVAAAVRRALRRSWDTHMLQDNARRFSPTAFRASFGAAIEAALNRKGTG